MGRTPLHMQHNKIGGTAANIIYHEHLYESNLLTLWQELTGVKPPVDLSDNIPVQIGLATENFNRKHFSEITGFEVRTPNEVMVSKDRPYCVGQLDGIVIDETGDALFEAKHTGTYDFGSKSTKTVEHLKYLYRPQLQHYMYVAELPRAYLSVLFGNSRYDYLMIERDDVFIAALMKKIDTFWHLVEANIPPKLNGKSSVVVEMNPGKTEVIDSSHSSSNEWASAAAAFLECQEAAGKFDVSKKTLKDLAPKDAHRTEGYGVSVVNSGKRRNVYAL